MDNNITVVEFSRSEFDELFLDANHESDQAAYLYKYLEESLEGGLEPCRAMIVESVYHSGHYKAEYAQYYCTCFSDFPSYSRRVHFFGHLSVEELTNYFDGALQASGQGANQSDREKCREQLKEHFLGYTAIRPIPAVKIGYTLIPYYKTVAWNRTFLGIEKNAHLAGITLPLVAAPFMQQDRSVAVCASMAIWFALQLMPAQLARSRPSTVDITEAATKFKVKCRTSPARKGLDQEQMSEAIRSFGWDPESLSPGKVDWARAIVRAYIRSGRPVIATGIRSDPPHPLVGHAMTVVGVSENESDSLHWAREGRAIDVPAPRKIYLHDDRIGPYIRATIEDVTPNEKLAARLGTRGPLPGLHIEAFEKREKWVLLRLLVPRYPPVKLSIVDLLDVNRSVIANLPISSFRSDECKELRMDCYIQSGQSVLEEISTISKLDQPRLVQFLKTISLPDYAGVVNVASRERPLFTLLWDTTDFCRSISMMWQHLLAVVCYQPELWEQFTDWINSSEIPPERAPKIL